MLMPYVGSSTDQVATVYKLFDLKHEKIKNKHLLERRPPNAWMEKRQNRPCVNACCFAALGYRGTRAFRLVLGRKSRTGSKTVLDQKPYRIMEPRHQPHQDTRALGCTAATVPPNVSQK